MCSNSSTNWWVPVGSDDQKRMLRSAPMVVNYCQRTTLGCLQYKMVGYHISGSKVAGLKGRINVKLLLFSDVHCSVEHCQELVKKAESVDIVVGAGDIGNMRSGLNETIEILAAITKPTILVPGNSESREELESACGTWQSATILHGSGAEIENLQFYGLGGGIPVTPFGSWSYDFDEEQAESMLANCPKNCILVTHSPPKGAGDQSSSGENFGSVAIRAAIMAKTPRVAICGHIHESAGKQEKLAETPVINAGPKGVVWEL